MLLCNTVLLNWFKHSSAFLWVGVRYSEDETSFSSEGHVAPTLRVVRGAAARAAAAAVAAETSTSNRRGVKY